MGRAVLGGPPAGIGPLLGAPDGWPVGAAWVGGGVTGGLVLSFIHL